MDAPAPRLNLPTPVAPSVVVKALAVLGLRTSPAVLPDAVMLALIFILFEAVSVRVVLALHATTSFTLTSPDPVELPRLLINSTLVLPRLPDNVAPVMSPPLLATV